MVNFDSQEQPFPALGASGIETGTAKMSFSRARVFSPLTLSETACFRTKIPREILTRAAGMFFL
jgi:hypothetical protein